MLRLVSPPQQRLSRLLQQRHARFLRSYRRHSLHYDLHKKTNLTMVVGETFGTPLAAFQAAHVVSFLLHNLPLLDISVIRRFHDHTTCSNLVATFQAAVVASFPLYNLLPLDISVIRRFHDHTIYLFEFLSYTFST